MKILHLNTWDSVGGAARAVNRLHQGLIDAGIDSKILVQGKQKDDPRIIGSRTKYQQALAVIRPHIERLPLSIYPSRKTLFHFQWLPNDTASKINHINPDVIHMHWVCGGFIPVKAVAQFSKPIVWTLHDMWPFTGGCHLTGSCERYKENCGRCPQLGGTRNMDLTRWTWRRKNRTWKNVNMTLVSPSSWLADCAKSSSLLKRYATAIIPNGLNVARFKRIDKKIARKIIGLNPDKRYILFGAIGATRDSNKGFHLFLDAVRTVSRHCPDSTEIIIFGESRSNYGNFKFGLKVNYIDRLYDDISLSILYSASDVLVVPSLQESFGQTASEAMACGTPVVAFNTTGLKDIIDDGENGCLVPPFNKDIMAARICEVLALDQEKLEKMRRSARAKAKHQFDISRVASQHIHLYKSILRAN